MIDWITCVLPFRHETEISGGVIAAYSESGEIQWQKRRFARAESTFDQSVAIQTSNNHLPLTYIWMSGCPAKFLQGHNCFGSNNLPELVALMATRALEAHGHVVTDLDVQRWRSGYFDLSTVDITEHLAFPSQADCLAAIRFIGQHATVKHRGGGVMKEGTVYFGKRSRRWALKIYSKYMELNARCKGHGLPDGLPLRDDLLAWCEGDMRIEVRLCSMELKKQGLNKGTSWIGLDVGETFNIYVGKMQIPNQTSVSTESFAHLPSGTRLAYLAWKRGEDVRGSVSRMTFWRYRRALLEHKIDLCTPPASDDAPLLDIRSVTQAQTKRAPSWAITHHLLVA